MMMKSTHDSPILVTGAAGAVGAIGRNLTAMLLAKGHKVRALVRREDGRADALRRLGAEVVQGDLTDLASMHRAVEGCARIYFGMSVSAAYLEATVNTAAVARHHGVEAFVNMSQMTVTQMSITETTDSPQHKLHWLAEQALHGRGCRSSRCGRRSSWKASSCFSPLRVCATPMSWRCRWAPARPRPSHRSTSRAPSRRSSTTRRHTSVTSTI
jgi:NADPH:quinone reductase-like Zn-dependent oxidoreductase